MSSIKLSPNASGTGIFTIAAPNSNVDRTITLPDVTGTVVTANASGNVTISGNLTLADYANIGATNNNAGISLTGGSVTNNGAQINLRGGSFSGNTSGIELITDGTERARIASNGQQSSVIPGGSTLYPEYKCRAWVNFNGTGTVAIRASGNVSSITDNGTGSYTVNFTTAMPDANYSSYGSCRPTAGGSPHYLFYVENRDGVIRSTTALQIYYLNPTVQLAQDPEVASVCIVR